MQAYPAIAQSNRPATLSGADVLYGTLTAHSRRASTRYSTVTLFARLRGLSTSVPRSTAV